MVRERFNTGMELKVDRAESLIVELMQKNDFLDFNGDYEKIEVIGEGRLIAISRGKGSREWYANNYVFQDGIIRLDEVDKTRFRSKKAVYHYCQEQIQGEKN